MEKEELSWENMQQGGVVALLPHSKEAVGLMPDVQVLSSLTFSSDSFFPHSQKDKD